MKNILNLSFLYRLFVKLTGNNRARKVFSEECVKARDGDRIIDIGCGTGELLPHLPNVIYEGFDLNKNYIETAIKTYGHRAKFYCKTVSEKSISESAKKYDIAIASGILHHLDDEEAKKLFQLAWQALDKGGRLLTLDGVYFEGQSIFEKIIMSNDRGQFVRSESEYKNIAQCAFSNIKSVTYKNLLYFPYTLLVLECTRN